jgi:sec-independent protein translocase protein TatB
MLDLGWSEILLIAAVAIVVMGPQDIPKVMLGLGRVMRRFQYIKYALSQQFEDVMKVTDLDDLRKVNFEKSKNLPDFDEAEGDLEDYNEGQMRPKVPAAPPEGRND